MLKEIGSNFWLNPMSDILSGRCYEKILQPDVFNKQKNQVALLSTGRGALALALNEIVASQKNFNNIALIPPFTCETVIRPFLEAGFRVFSYEIDERLYLTGDMLRKAIEQTKATVVLIHRYYGFDTQEGLCEVISEYRKKKVTFIEDRTQNILSGFPSLPVDYIVGSFRKWTAIPDGGYCIKTEKELSYRALNCDSELVQAALYAFGLKNEYMEHNRGEKALFLKAYADAKTKVDEEKQLYRMSDEGINIWNSLDLEVIGEKRRRNYRYLYDRIRKIENINMLTGRLNEAEVPLYMAIRTKNRNILQGKLRENDIYAPIIWGKSDISPQICRMADEIYKEVLCIPIDQRYDLDDMERIAVCMEDKD